MKYLIYIIYHIVLCVLLSQLRLRRASPAYFALITTTSTDDEKHRKLECGNGWYRRHGCGMDRGRHLPRGSIETAFSYPPPPSPPSNPSRSYAAHVLLVQVGSRHSTSAVVLPAVLVFFEQATLVYAGARHGKISEKADAAMSDKKVDAGEKEHPAVVDSSMDAAAESNDASVKGTNSSVMATVPRHASKSANRRKRSKHSKIGSRPPAADAVEERRQQQHVQSQQRPITQQERPIDLDDRDDEDDPSQGSASEPAVGSTDDAAIVGGGGVAVDAEALGVLSEHRGTDENNSKEAEAEGSKECTETGPCVWCGDDELELEYCQETGRRQEVSG